MSKGSIAVIGGTGAEGSGLAVRWANDGYRVIIGSRSAEKALKAGVSTITFDRGGNLYHGRVKSLAEGAREAGLKF